MGESREADGTSAADGGANRWAVAAVGVVLVALLVGGLWVVRLPLGECGELHLVSQFAGSTERFGVHLGNGCSALRWDDVVLSFALDSVFAVVYGTALAFALWRAWDGWRVTVLTRRKRQVVMLPLVAAGVDVVENGLTLGWLRTDSTGPHLTSDFGAVLITTAAWVKWVLLLASVIALVTAEWATVAPRPHRDRPVGKKWTDPVPAPLGICCSGGGVRAAAYTLGALQALDDKRILHRSRWLAAVSGGAYTAAACATRPDGLSAALNQLEYRLEGGGAAPSRHRFLLNDPGGIARSILWILGCVAFNVVVVLAVVVAVAWPVGWLLDTWVFNSIIVGPTTDGVVSATSWSAVVSVPRHHWIPGALLVGLGAVVAIIGAFLSTGATKFTNRARPLLVLGTVVALVSLLLPVALQVAWWLLDGQADQLRVPAAFGVVATIAGVLWSAGHRRLARAIPRLGGAVLAVLLVVLGGYIAVDGIRESGPFQSPWWWYSTAGSLVVAFLFLPIGWTSGRLMYRNRLRRSFSLAPTQEWTDVTARFVIDDDRNGPELLLCAAAQRNGRTGNGIPADSFTISPTSVTYAGAAIPTSAYLNAFDRWSGAERTVSSWQATTGAAFSSAMGRVSYGTTNALLAALNIDLGGWVPNPSKVAEGFTGFPAVRLGYLLKEILGIYQCESDDQVFVADGGQWENLGLVELLRRRCLVIICLDASGDEPGSFTTLRQAVELATTELDGVTIDLAFLDKGLRAPPGELPQASVGTTTISYGPHLRGTLVYAKAQVARSLPAKLRQFANQDPKFPHYSTMNQFLTDEQFRNLVELGRNAGTRAGDLASRPLDRIHAVQTRIAEQPQTRETTELVMEPSDQPTEEAPTTST